MPEQQDDKPQQPSGDIRETGIARVMTSTSIHKHPTAFFNTRLPVLEVALNVEAMTERLGPLLQSLASGSGTPAVKYAKLLAYKQGNRGLIHYDVTGTIYGEQCVVLGKLYPELNQANRVNATMQALWNEVFVGSAQLGIPQPLGCLSELSMLLYIPAEGEFLGDVINSEQILHYMELAGAWLGRLHQYRLPLDRKLQIANELVNLQAWAALIGHKYPDQAEAATRVANHLKESANVLEFESHAPVHKDFHYGHIVVDGGLKVIDFDEMRLGDPNFDLAHFCANLHLLAYRANNSPFQFSALQSEFLNAYSRYTGWAPNERFIYFYAYTCLKIAKQLCSMRGLRPRPEGEEQHRQVQLMLEQGVGSLPQDTAKGLAGMFATQVMRIPPQPAPGAPPSTQNFATQIFEIPKPPPEE
jgi:hypothetical protein